MKTLYGIACALAALAGTAQAGVVDMQVNAGDISALTLPVDNQWNGSYGDKGSAAPGQDWGYTMMNSGAETDSIWVTETWTDSSKHTASLDVGVQSVGRADPTITLNKDVNNVTGYAWTAFTIVLSTQSGNVTLLGSPTSSDFSTAQIVNNPSPNVTMNFSGGTIAPGATGHFTFTFSVPMSGFWTFTITQTPVPAPGALVLAGAGLLASVRRRR